MKDIPDYKDIEQVLGYNFKDISILENAFRHSSYVNELIDTLLEDNERLEFLGDAVVNLVVGDLLMERFPKHREGDLSRMRSSLVNEKSLAEISRTLGLGYYIMLGKGERQTRGNDKNSILSDTYEAMIAAIYLDGGFEVVWNIIKKHFVCILPDKESPFVANDSKSLLQEIAQTKFKLMPQYKITGESGPDHNKIFEASLKVGDIICNGSGKSKKMAEQKAAAKAIKLIESDS